MKTRDRARAERGARVAELVDLGPRGCRTVPLLMIRRVSKNPLRSDPFARKGEAIRTSAPSAPN